MKTILPFILVSLMVLTACVPVELYHQTGVSLQRQQSELGTCHAQALQQAPVNMRTEVTPSYYVSARQHCAPNGTGGVNCTTYGGYWEGGQVYTYDTNEQLRRTLTENCMRVKGYAHVRLPRCSREQIAATGTASTRQPPLTKESCAAQSVGGQWVVLEP